jgi:nucleoside-diphosphate-sugar epimerase
MNQRVLVLGASGFIGRRTVLQLARHEGVTVIATSRRAVHAPPAAGILTQVLDARDEPALRRALVGATGVINCAAGDSESLIAAARAQFAAGAQSIPAPRIVHLSSLSAYGSIDGAVDETVPPRGDLGPYSAAKLMTEKLAADYGSAVILRPGIVYGASSPWWSDRIARLLCARRLGDLGGAGEGFCNLVHVEDVATAVLKALNLPGIEGQTFNLSLTTAPTWNEYFARYAEALGALPLRRISSRRLAIERRLWAPPLKLMELTGQLRLLRGISLPPPIRPWLLTLCRHRIAMIGSRAETTLGMRWMTLEEGLKDAADWFLQGGRT